MSHTRLLTALMCMGTCLSGLIATPRLHASEPAKQQRVLSRLFFQDAASATLQWCDVLAENGGQLSPPQAVSNFPALDPDKQSLVQMRSIGRWLLIGIRDKEQGQFGSGWVLLDTGVRVDEHGDHVHWSYPESPSVRAQRIDETQGNPAHVYVYDDAFYIANDLLDGFTHLDPQTIDASMSSTEIAQQARFYKAGGGHITIAATQGWAFATWLDREGENRGRVDAVRLVDPAVAKKHAPSSTTQTPDRHVFHLSEGGLHGATACGDKVFFAPAADIHWVSTAALANRQTQPITAQVISLGSHNDQPRRTGSFTKHGSHVLFVNGHGEATELGVLDASADTPTLQRLPIDIASESRPSSPYVAQPFGQSPLAFVFHDHSLEADAPNLVTMVELDPNRDGDWSDARVDSTLEVGRSALAGHSGHHFMAASTAADRGWVSNPGDGTITQLRLRKRSVMATFSVGGSPAQILAIGEPGYRSSEAALNH